MEEQKKTTAKNCSKWTMILASLWIAILTLLKCVELIKIDMPDIIYSSVAIVGIWSPTYLSIWLDKITDIKWGKSE